MTIFDHILIAMREATSRLPTRILQAMVIATILGICIVSFVLVLPYLLNEKDGTPLREAFATIGRAVADNRIFFGTLGAALMVLGTFITVIRGLLREQGEYEFQRRFGSGLKGVRSDSYLVHPGPGDPPNEKPSEVSLSRKRRGRILDASDPDEIFIASRNRLLDEAIRLDSISRRNLIIGILFSAVALSVLAWPLIAAAFQPIEPGIRFEVVTWAAQYYLPRFAVGILLQFVGFFFLRLYVANELDLKHNKNELTNLEMKMMALQLAKEFGDAASKKEIMKSLAATERNFIIRKNEKSVSTEALSEYNDLKGMVEKLLAKIPGAK